jgi:hypothetical protein
MGLISKFGVQFYLMARRKHRALRILGWIVAGFVSLILLLTLGFYLGRGWIMNKAVAYVNDQQPGEVRMEQMYLIPFKNFPDVSLQLRNMSYYERAQHPDSLYQEPILYVNELNVTLDVVDLIRKNIEVSEASIENGFFRLEVYADSISNLEKALGLQRVAKEVSEASKLPEIHMNLEKLELANMKLFMKDQPGDMQVSLIVDLLESSFSYLPEKVNASIKVNLDVDSINYLTYRDKTARSIVFESEVTLQPESKTIQVKPSRLEVSGLELETWGSYDYSKKPSLDFEFTAKNEGLELLNHIFRGVLDLDELEQIGDGSISLTGDIKGFLGDTLPVVRLEGSAHELGFRIKSIQQEVSGISFKLHASNGKKLDFSEGFVQIEDFKANLPEGDISANLSAFNLLSPELKINLQGDLNLWGVDDMIETDLVSRLDGRLSFEGDMEATLDRESRRFRNNQGFIHTRMEDVGFLIHGDSLSLDSVKHLNGKIDLEENHLGARDLELEYNGNLLNLDLHLENILLYAMGLDVDLKADLSASADVLKLATLTRDTSLTGLLGEEIEGLHFRAGALISSRELDDLITNKSIPELDLTLDSLGVKISSYAPISKVNASLSLAQDSLVFHYLNGVVGESAFDFSGHVENYGVLFGQDSAEVMSLGFNLASDLMLAEDFFTLKDEFILPAYLQTEYLEDFHLEGLVDIYTEGLLNDSLSMNFALRILDLGWNFRYYPYPFQEFLMEVSREGDQLFIQNFQGRVGESNLKMQARLENFSDSVMANWEGELVLESDMLDFNKLMNYQVPGKTGKTKADSLNKEAREAPRLDQISYPQFSFNVDIGELRYGDFNFFDLDGQLRSSKDKIFYLDQLSLSGRSGGSMAFHGQFNVANPYMYTFSAELDMQDLNVDDLDIEMQSGDTVYTLKENFDGLVSADGMAEIFITPELRVDMAATTAIFNVRIEDGALINFTPLQAAAKFLDNRDLNYVKFATLQNSFPLTLMDSRITVPLMIVESTAGQMLIEGEQGLDKSFLYLLRIPPKLAREATRSVLTESKDKEKEDEIQKMRRGNFYMMTVWSDGVTSDFKLGDRRDKFQE